MGFRNKIRIKFAGDDNSDSEKAYIFRFADFRWYQANAGLFKHTLHYENVKQIKENHENVVLIHPLTSNPCSYQELFDAGY